MTGDCISTSTDKCRFIEKYNSYRRAHPFLHQQKAKSCAIVNTKLYGLLPFWFEMKRAGIHPVVGLTIQLELTEDQSLPLVLYAKTNEGYRNLLKISSSISIRPEQTIPLRWSLAYGKGIAFMFPVLEQQAIWLQQDAESLLKEIMKAYPHEVYIGISRLSDTADVESAAVRLAEKMLCRLWQLMKVYFSMKRTFCL